jgi:hypothetical protein
LLFSKALRLLAKATVALESILNSIQEHMANRQAALPRIVGSLARAKRSLC